MLRSHVGSVYSRLHTYSNKFVDAFSFTGNPAALAKSKKFSAGLLSEKRFLLKELSTYSIAVAQATPSGNFGITGDYFGSAAYNEGSLGLAYARKLGEKVDVGVQFIYTSLKAGTYGSASAVTFDAGGIIHLTEALQTGIHVYNPSGIKLGKAGEERLASVYAAGLGYDVSPQFYIGIEAQKVEGKPININSGFQYVFAEKLSARAGISSATSSYYLGFAIQIKTVWLHAAATFHPYLGITPGLLSVYTPRE